MKKNGIIIVVLFFLLGCEGTSQEIKNSIAVTQNKTKEIDSISLNFNKVSDFYFDIEKSIPYGTYINPEIGEFTIEYNPIEEKDKKYFKNFLASNNINIEYDELNDKKFISPSDQKKTASVLRKILKNKSRFNKIGAYISKKYIEFEINNEYSISFPYKIEYYKNSSNQNWKLIKEQTINNYEDAINTKKDISNKQTLSDLNEIVGLWQTNCSISNSGIDISLNGDKLTGTLALAPPAIFIDVSLEKNKEKGTYYVKYVSQDMSPPMAEENEIDETIISKEEAIGKITVDGNEIDFYWYGLLNTKTKERTNLTTQFSNDKLNNLIKLRKCINGE